MAEPSIEGEDAHGARDALGRPVGRMMLEAAGGPRGEGWVHYMRSRPGEIFPVWKSSFVKRVTLLDGARQLVDAGVYNLKRNEPFIEAMVEEAARLVEERGTAAFPTLRDRSRPFAAIATSAALEAIRDIRRFSLDTDGQVMDNHR